MSDLVVFRCDIVDQSVERGMIGIKVGSDGCLVKVRIADSGAVVPVFSSAILCLNGDSSLVPITSILRVYFSTAGFTRKRSGLSGLPATVETRRNAAGCCERRLASTREALLCHCPKAAEELDQALTLLGCYHEHHAWRPDGEHDFLLHVGRAALEICGPRHRSARPRLVHA
jgi:hypothetical protein